MNSVDPVWCVDPGLRALQPNTLELLDVANARAWIAVPPVLLEQIRLRVAALVGNNAGLLRRSRAARERGLTESKIAQLAVYYKSDDYSAVEKLCLAFAEQFVIDVSSITEADRAGLAHHFTAEQCQEFVTALYVTECTQRLEMVAPALLDSRAGDSTFAPATMGQVREPNHIDDTLAGLIAVLERYQEAVVLGTALDLVVTEMVRLRCARTHGCRICKTLRLINAREAGVDDAMTAKIDFYEHSDLDERIKIALRITDAFITRPDTLTDAVIRQARSAFTPEALAELCLDITKWSTQKIYVALGTDTADILPKNEQGTSFFSFDNDGRVRGFTPLQNANTDLDCP
jgi:alkylhydroperoxidase family enzyme